MSHAWFVRILGLVALRLALGNAPVSAAVVPRPKASLHVRVPDTAGMAVKRALLVARQRLGGARCQQVFSSFRSDATGRSLGEVLERLGRTPEEHLDALVFQDGSRRGRCASPSILAFTRPGTETVFVCASQFNRAVRNDPVYAEIILIHELLHTLGLGENPPTSLDITARVTERCGDAPARRAEVSP